MRRIVYSPEVQVFIQPGGLGSNGQPIPPVDISNDIIEGSISRKSDDISTAHFVVQNRRLSTKVIRSTEDEDEFSTPPQKLLLSNFRPMDRIVVYLKKTKPILVFTGYLDLVPMLQFVPEPVVIEASCTLKRLQFTYWDPTLPSVMNALIKIGFVPTSAGDQGLNVLQVPKNSPIVNEVQDTGFPLLLQFLLQDVGGWANKDIFIEPIPEKWIESVRPLFQEFQKTDNAARDASSFLSSIVGAAGGNNDNGPAVVGGPDYRQTYKATGGGWETVTSTHFGGHDDASAFNKSMANGEIANDETWGFGETSNNYNAPVSQMDFAALGDLPKGTKIEVRSLKNKGLTILVAKKDVGGGGPGLHGHKRAIDLCYASAKAIGHTGLEDVEWRLYNPKKNPAPPDIGGNNDRGTDPTRSDVSTKSSDKNKLTIYLEAFDAPVNGGDSRQPGYQDKDILGRNLNDDRSKRRINQNIELATRVMYHLNNLVSKKNLKSNPFDIILAVDNSRFANGRQGYNGDIYITIDHSDWIYSTSTDADGHKFSDVNRAYAFAPNQYSEGLTQEKGGSGTGWTAPGSVNGRKSAAGKGIIANSNKLISMIEKAYTNGSVKGFSSTMSGDGHAVNNIGPFSLPPQTPYRDDAHTFIPGFFYSHTSAALYLEFPTVALQGDDAFDVNQNPDLKKLFETRAEQIAEGLYLYLKEYKSQGKQKTVGSGNVNNPNDGTQGNGTSMVGNEKFFNPLGKAKWGQGSGVRDHQTGRPGVQGKNWQSDFAMDMTVPYGTPVFAPFNGKIIKAGVLNSKNPLLEGIRIGLQGDGGYSAYLAHLSSISVKEGDTVVGGQQIGLSGKAGIDHLHFGMAKGPYDAPYGAGIDPTPFLTGASTNVSAGDGGTGTGSGADGSGSGNSVQDALNAAFNVSFNFPGSLADSLILRGVRALENDVPLINSVAEVTKASMRSFSSLPNGAFVAWYPDYFNLSKRTAWLKVSPMELKSCTIDLSDKSLTTHVYILGNTQGLGADPAAAAASTWLEKLKGTGVVTIEQSKILDSFLGSGFEDYLDLLDYDGLPVNNKRNVSTKNKKGKKVTREVEDQLDKDKSAPLAFLERYGARPYLEQNLTIRHPLFEFFYAYHTFIQKWAQQFISKIELTFMPELFPGMIIEIDDPHKRNITFYVQDVTHNFSYQNGFNTTATLIAPGVATEGKITRENPAYGLIPVVLIDGLENKNKNTTTVTPRGKLTYQQWLKKHHWGSTKAHAKEYKKYKNG